MSAAAKSPFAYRTQSGKWRFVLTEDFTVHLSLFLRGSHLFVDRGLSIARLDGSLLTIFAGYAWDGCSGPLVPSPESTRAASCVHDCLYQFGQLPCAPWSREMADEVFFQLLRANRFPLAGIYFGAVAVFGGLYRWFNRRPSASILCITHH